MKNFIAISAKSAIFAKGRILCTSYNIGLILLFDSFIYFNSGIYSFHLV